MEILTKFRFLSVVQTYYKMMQTRSVKIDNFLRLREGKRPKALEKIPNFQELWAKYYSIVMTENFYKKTVFDELVKECNINIDPEVHYLEKLLIIESDIGTLVKNNYIKNVDCVVEGLLSHLESFPFDNKKIMSEKENINCLTIKLIRDLIEEEYLAWKLKVDLNQLKEILWRYRFCLFEYRSMTTLGKNIKQLEELPKSSEKCVAEIIYLINQKPFNLNSIAHFQKTAAGLNWVLFPEYCPQVLRHSHQYIIFIVSILKTMKFTEKQIREGLPFLHLRFLSFFKRLNSLLIHPKLAKYQYEDKFLHLLSYYTPRLYDLVDLKGADFEELTEYISFSKNLKLKIKYTTLKSIMHYVNQYYTLDYSCTKTLKKDQRYKIVSAEQINDTLEFLKNQDFSSNEVEESMPIILYPRNLIEKALIKIKEEKLSLKKYGFNNGCVPKQTNFFSTGTKERQKILQLCLYYLEKPNNFSGRGLWSNSGDIAIKHT